MEEDGGIRYAQRVMRGLLCVVRAQTKLGVREVPSWGARGAFIRASRASFAAFNSAWVESSGHRQQMEFCRNG